MLHNMWHTGQLIMIVSLDIINNNQIRCHSLAFCNVTGTFIYFKTIKLTIATTLVVNVRVPFNFTTWNKVVYTSGYVITYIIKTTEPNHLILILNLANKSYFIIKVNFCHLLAWFKNYDPLKVGVNSFWDTLYNNAALLLTPYFAALTPKVPLINTCHPTLFFSSIDKFSICHQKTPFLH